MAKGKSICEYLKNLRKQIAEANGIDYTPRQCAYEGDCSGTCPACEREREYIESQLSLRQKWGAPLKIVGLSVALASGAACASNSSVPVPSDLQEEYVDSSKGTTSCSVPHQPENEDEEWMGCIVEEHPEFPGGMSALATYIKENLRYPEEAKQKGIKGRVVLSFVIGSDGSISDVKVMRSVHPLLDAEAVRLVESMPKWIPGKQMGKVIRTRYNLPVLFRLTEETKN